MQIKQVAAILRHGSSSLLREHRATNVTRPTKLSLGVFLSLATLPGTLPSGNNSKQWVKIACISF